MSQTLLASRHGPVHLLTLNRPDKMNALNSELTRALLDALRAAEADAEVAVILLTGAGRAFCAGADVTEFKDLAQADPQAIAAHADRVAQLFGIVPTMTKPVLGAINGFALGGGCGLALSCDMAIAAESATFGYPEVKRGVVPAVVVANLVRQVGRKAAFELVAMSETVGAARARELGMINRIVPADALMREALGIATTLAERSRDALGATKRLFHRVADIPLQPALEIARDANVIMRGYRMKSTV